PRLDLRGAEGVGSAKKEAQLKSTREAERQATAGAGGPSQGGPAGDGGLASAILALQQHAGNAAVTRAIMRLNGPRGAAVWQPARPRGAPHLPAPAPPVAPSPATPWQRAEPA